MLKVFPLGLNTNSGRENMHRRPVAAGSYHVSPGKNEILEAHLGTCVGVTLIDKQAQVGGLVHLLLPEPSNMSDVWQPQNYARTGLPIFIRALCDQGAHKDRLVACVAGGGLIGPISETDLNLDIGGRTAEVVEAILKGEGIPVPQFNTGGHYACSLSLNLKTWEARISLSNPGDISVVPMQPQKPPSIDMEKEIAGVRPIPQIALKIIRMIRHDRYGLREIGRVIRKDQVLTAKVIRLCNSAFFNMKVKINSVDRALVLMGEKRFLQMIVSASVEEFFPQQRQGYSLCKGGLYRHALGVAMITEMLAGFSGAVSEDIAYTAGLLHDIGKVVLDQYVTQYLPLFYHRTQVADDQLTAVEEELLGTDHTATGAQMAAAWHLPDRLADVIAHHHQPEAAVRDPQLVHLVYLADLLMSRFAAAQEMDRLDTAALGDRIERAGLHSHQIVKILEQIPRHVFDLGM